MAFNNDRLLDQIKLLGAVADGRYEDQELLDLAYDALISEVCPLLITVREEYLVRTADTSIAASTSRYAIHDRALGGSLRDVRIVDGTSVTELNRIDPEEARLTTGTPDSFYIEGNYVVLSPVPASATGTLRQSYYVRPGKLVPASEAAVITAINTGTNTLTCTFPSDWTTSDTFDLIRAKGGFEHLAIDQACSSVTGTSMVFTSSLPSGLAVGDYVAIATESPIPQIPQELHSYLTQLSVSLYLEAMKDMEGLQVSTAKGDRLRSAAVALLSNRVQGAPKKFKSSLV